MRLSLLCLAACAAAAADTVRPAPNNVRLEQTLLKGYNRKHRPVKKESSTVMVSVILSVTHVEKVNEHEQTMIVHGHLWASWTDEYLTWKPADYNGSSHVAIDSWKIWQPALSLYNSGRGNSWHLYMHGLPAIVSSEGVVFSAGSFSFHITCLFDFSDWPYDEQRCPIVIADWVYDLSRVNLSDESAAVVAPQLRLNYDPAAATPKKNIAGWTIEDSWRRHCYWGHQGCKEDSPEGQPEWYWSLLEFGLVIRRHAPYIFYTLILPTVISSGLTLASFWIDTKSFALTLLLFNIGLQGLFGWDLIRQLPPGSGRVPKIVSLYALNLCMTALAVVFHLLTEQLLLFLPESIDLPAKVTELAKRMRSTKAFHSHGVSFDPQALLNGADISEASSSGTPPPAMVSPDGSVLLQLEGDGETAAVVVEAAVIEEEREEEKTEDCVASLRKTKNAIAFARRILFFIYALLYAFAIPFYLF